MKKLFLVSIILSATPAVADDATEIVTYSAIANKVPVEFALKVAERESGIRCGRVGKAGERGPMQVLPKTATWLGFKNIKNTSCAVQTNAGMKHLKMCFDGADGDMWLAAACHNQGISALSGKVGKHAVRYANAVVGSN